MKYINEIQEGKSSTINLDEAGAGIPVVPAKEQKLPVPARIQEFQSEYAKIYNTEKEGKRNADNYARTRF